MESLPILDLVSVTEAGVTDSDLVRGVRFFGGGARTHSLVMTRRTGHIRFVDGIHISDRAKAGSILL